MDGNQPQKLLTVKEAAAYLGQSQFTIYRKISAGTLPAVRLTDSPTGPLRVPERDLHQFIFGEARR